MSIARHGRSEIAGAGHASVSLHYLQSTPIAVVGTATGRRYVFSAAQPVQPVDARDAEGLLRSQLFRKSS